MKKFVVVMITILVLFVFLMLNYLLWDKENLLKQSESDKLEQDWLRGQNRTLQSTVNEQEQTIKALEKEKDDLLNRISNLEQALRLANSQAEGYRNQIAGKDQVIGNYKRLMQDELCGLAMDWFESISKRDYEAAWALMDANFMAFGSRYTRDDFFRYLGAIHSIALVRAADAGEKAGGQNDGGYAFEILKEYGADYEVIAVVQAEVVVDLKQAGDMADWVQGTNRLQMNFRFDPSAQKWAISGVLKASN
ncbi:hypothetical protein [Thermoclostridium caenicola]|uniref:Uncharacterized protein n=1 Tax=Thermoclostridium caenicola TaxID=659425 RepID=A0A1M6C3H5_9FIRM|nr:hypothetical protein [Thermoclostridium caenicola]SHI55258.1 hypothetical protein SAMN05444373_100426 [Thermoclostridium caenicola]